MKYAVLVHHDEGSAYGVTVPDIPGCFSAGETFDEALTNTIEAIEFHLDGLEEDGALIPNTQPVDVHMAQSDVSGGVWGFVDIDITPYLGKTEKINVTLPSKIVRAIDAKHPNRSRFLAEAAIKELA